MKLLFDENLSRRLIPLLANDYPDSAHVVACGLGTVLDDEVFRFAGIGGYVLVTQDRDFTELSALRGSPPKVVWLRAHNLATRQIAQVLRQQKPALQALVDDPTKSLLVLHATAP